MKNLFPLQYVNVITFNLKRGAQNEHWITAKERVIQDLDSYLSLCFDKLLKPPFLVCKLLRSQDWHHDFWFTPPVRFTRGRKEEEIFFIFYCDEIENPI